MKSIGIFKIIIVLFSFSLITAGCAYREADTAMNSSAPDGYNINELNSYGDWVHLDRYGEAWRPYAINDWKPFTDGYWAFAGGDWTWVSYEPFGWIVYHYGYWYYDQLYGWVWIPSDNPWSPARVNWVDYGNYIGWSPIPPPGIIYGPPWESRSGDYWDVVRKQDFVRQDVGNYRVQNPIRNDMGGRNEVRNEPPEKGRLESSTGNKINEVHIPLSKVEVQKREMSKMNLPPTEEKKVRDHAGRVKRDVLISHDKYRQQQKEKKRE